MAICGDREWSQDENRNHQVLWNCYLIVGSYIAQSGIIEKLKLRIDKLLKGEQLALATSLSFIEKCFEFLEALTAFSPLMTSVRLPVYAMQRNPTIDSLISTFKETDFMGIISLLLSLLFHRKRRKSEGSNEEGISDTLLPVILTAVKIINNIGTLDLVFLQDVCGSEQHNEELFQLFNYLITYCTSDGDEKAVDKKLKILNEVLLLLGYCTLQNEKNQEILRRGKNPTLLHRLCSLPFQYFSDARYKCVLFPTLITGCFMNNENFMILKQEMSTELLLSYIKEELNAMAITSQPQKEIPHTPKIPPRYQLQNRVPSALWENAIQYLK